MTPGKSLSPRYLAIPCALMASSAALAELPEPVRAMVDAAIATGDAQKVATVIELASQTNPGNAAELSALHEGFKEEQARIAAAQAKDKELAIRQSGIFDHWSGSGEIGAFYSSGNTSETGVTLGVKLKRQGIDWSHDLRGRVDYKETNGIKTREQFLFAYEPRYQIGKSLFAYGLAQYERDRFQGFLGRYAVSGGLGYKLVDNERVNLAVKAGPAFRVTKFLDGTSENRLAGLAGYDFDWKISDRVKFNQDTNMVAETASQGAIIFDASNTSVVLANGLEAKISDRLSTRLSFTLEYDSNPPEGAMDMDTLSRFTLLYGF